MSHWVVLAFAAPMLWAVVALIDTALVQGVFADPLDGVVITGLFQSLLWLLVPLGFVSFTPPPLWTGLLSVAAGGCFVFSFRAYFQALFQSNDSALMQLLWNLSVPLVPVLAWLLLGERLGLGHYAGIALALAGMAVFAVETPSQLRGAALPWPVLRTMLMAVFWMAMSMVASKAAYNSVGTPDFWSQFLLFGSGASLATLVLLLAHSARKAVLRRLGALCLRYGLIFVLGESLTLAGTLASQRAISLTPAVSLVALIESLVPVFVMVTSVFLVWGLRGERHAALQHTYRQQLAHPRRKALALALISTGIYCALP